MNLGSIRTQTSFFVGDINQTRYTTTQYNNAINRAQEQFALETKALFKDTSWTTTSGTATYSLPSDFMWEDYVTYNGYELKPISRHELNRLNPGSDWTDRSGTPTYFIIDPEQASKVITLYPIPDDAQTLQMRYFPLPAEVSSDTDIPLNSSDLMAQFHMGLAALAGWMLLSSETMTPEIQAKMQLMMAYYTDSVVKAVDTFKNTASFGIQIKGSRIWN